MVGLRRKRSTCSSPGTRGLPWRAATWGDDIQAEVSGHERRVDAQGSRKGTCVHPCPASLHAAAPQAGLCQVLHSLNPADVPADQFWHCWDQLAKLLSILCRLSGRNVSEGSVAESAKADNCWGRWS